MGRVWIAPHVGRKWSKRRAGNQRTWSSQIGTIPTQKNYNELEELGASEARVPSHHTSKLPNVVEVPGAWNGLLRPRTAAFSASSDDPLASEQTSCALCSQGLLGLLRRKNI